MISKQTNFLKKTNLQPWTYSLLITFAKISIVGLNLLKMQPIYRFMYCTYTHRYRCMHFSSCKHTHINNTRPSADYTSMHSGIHAYTIIILFHCQDHGYVCSSVPFNEEWVELFLTLFISTAITP